MLFVFRTAALAAFTVALFFSAPAAIAQSADDTAFFEENVRPILEETCLECHDAEKQKGGLRLDSRSAVVRGGDHGLVVVPGNPDASKLIQAVRREGKLQMPPKEELFPQDVEVLVEWIRRGMPWPGSESEAESPELVEARSSRQVPVVTLAIDPGPPIKFDRDIRPLLADRCYACHGPDGAERKADLRLDDPTVALAPLPSGRTAIVPGSLEQSQLFQRVAAESPDDRMPPSDFHKSLNQEEIVRLGRWILQGAAWEQHWAFQPIENAAPPAVSNPGWVRNPIDSFVLSRLDAEGLSPAREADRRTLIRRVTLDLTGLPPTIDEVRDFVEDGKPGAYERLVDRLLASPRYGEHMARSWLDAARYADTNGYHIDNMRFMWRWRDWVIQAYNENKPFDEFTVEQLAGDLLPNPTLDQRIATGFNRNHMINFEGGAIPEEYRIQYVMDRVDTTSTVWMGLTMHCAQCHDHKFDPITQKEFYQFAAYFNTIEEVGLDARDGNAVPMIDAPLAEEADELERLKAEISALDPSTAVLPDDETRFTQWLAEEGAKQAARWPVVSGSAVSSAAGATLSPQADWSYLASGANPDKDTYEVVFDVQEKSISALRLEVLRDSSLPDNGPGRASNSNFVLTEFEVEASPSAGQENFQRITIANATADYSQPDFPVANAVDGKADTGWAGNAHELHEARSALFIPAAPFGHEGGTRVRVRLKHESGFSGHSIGRFRLSYSTDGAFVPTTQGAWLANGPYVADTAEKAHSRQFAPEKSKIELDERYRDGRARWFAFDPTATKERTPRLTESSSATYLYREINAPTDRNVTASISSPQRVKVWVNGELVHADSDAPGDGASPRTVPVPLHEGKNDLLVKVSAEKGEIAVSTAMQTESPLGLSHSVHLALAEPAETRRVRQIDDARHGYLLTHNSEFARITSARDAVQRELEEFKKTVPTTMVMAESATSRPTFVLTRGQYDQPQDEVMARTPSFLRSPSESAPNNRLTLAQWLTDEQNPLTARVTVNRFWQRVFGHGIVSSPEDFGTQGARPTHPELLDWLASEFVRSGWDVKNFMRMMVTSSTYRQSATPSPEALAQDPSNYLYSRGPRLRMDAETIRDNALALSGLLVEKIGGPSVYPYQPEGLWEEVSYKGGFSAQYYEQGHGPEQLYRRSMYTFWKRTSPPPGMMVFDAPNRETCTVQRGRTNTPLQALALMNDPQYVEAARAFAERIIKEGGRSTDTRIRFAFESATARPPTDDEVALLMGLFESQRDRFARDADAALELIAVGESDVAPKLDPAELAAWTTIASTMLNLDETITIG